MPTYTYRRADGTTFEIEQRITEDPLETCPTTGQAVTRIISGGVGLVFKGSGFYLTDYARKGNGSAASPPSTNGSDDTAKSAPSVTTTPDSASPGKKDA